MRVRRFAVSGLLKSQKDLVLILRVVLKVRARQRGKQQYTKRDRREERVEVVRQGSSSGLTFTTISTRGFS